MLAELRQLGLASLDAHFFLKRCPIHSDPKILSKPKSTRNGREAPLPPKGDLKDMTRSNPIRKAYTGQKVNMTGGEPRMELRPE